MTKLTSLKNSPELQRVFTRAFPGYRGRKWRVEARTSLFMADTYWDGGSRSQYVVINLDTLEHAHVPDLISGGFLPTAQAALNTLRDVPLRPGFAVVQHSIFCGKDTGLTLYVHPDNLTQFLTEKEKVS